MSAIFQIFNKSGSYFFTFQVVEMSEKLEDWMYSSQRNYSGLESLLDIYIADI